MLDSKPTRDIIMAFNVDSPVSIQQSVIVHETHHAATLVCERVGIEDEECEAYTQEYLYDQLMAQINTWKREHKDTKRKPKKNTKKAS